MNEERITPQGLIEYGWNYARFLVDYSLKKGVNYSSIDEIVQPIEANGNYTYTPGSAYGPDEQIWIYTSENLTDFYSSAISGTQRLPNGNTLICEGVTGTFFEVTPDNLTVWEYINPFPSPGSPVFKIRRHNLLFNPLISDFSMPLSNVEIEGGTFPSSNFFHVFEFLLNDCFNALKDLNLINMATSRMVVRKGSLFFFENP